ncbi:MAG: transglycosylase domain-containing protein [Armatimonadota bacterium]
MSQHDAQHGQRHQQPDDATTVSHLHRRTGKQPGHAQRRRLRDHQIPWPTRLKFYAIWSWLITLYTTAFLGTLFLACTLPSYRLADAPYVTPSVIYGSDGSVLAKFADENRSPVPLDKVPPHVVQAVLAAEDTRFYQHRGLDWRGMLRAAWVDIRARRLLQGGSTITQQLVRVELLDDRRTIPRKVREMILAVRVERGQSKQQILERYLNVVYFGSGAYGISSAAQTYFGKSVTHLSTAEGALLAGLIRSPGAGNPRHNSALAKRRQQAILTAMATRGWLTPTEYQRAKQEKITITPQQRTPWKAPYAIEMVREDLLARYGRDVVYRGGLTIYTTINPTMQRAAERALRHAVTAGRGRRVGNGALVAIEPSTGYIRALVGGTSFWDSEFNRAVQAHRQPGSAFKAFVYQAAIDKGYILTDRMLDAPVTAGNWSPKNYGSRYRGMVSLQDALAQSLNSVSVRLVLEMSPYSVMVAAENAGITSTLRPTLTLALGTSEVTPLEMARAFATFANNGVSVVPSLITEIRSDDQVLYRHTPIGHPTVRPVTVFQLTQGLEAVIKQGTGRRANIGRPAAGKTGTSNDFRDAWFIGYTPQLSTAVWLGNDNHSPMAGVAGGSLPAQAWAEFMRAAHRHLPPTDFPVPAGIMQVTLCAASHLPALPTCPHSYTQFLPLTRVPNQPCDLHYWVKRTVCAEGGLLPNLTCMQLKEQEFPYDEMPDSRCPINHALEIPGLTAPPPPPESATPFQPPATLPEPPLAPTTPTPPPVLPEPDLRP